MNNITPAQLRMATVADLAAINDIYNYYVIYSTATYQTEPSTDVDRLTWFEAHGPQHPVIVAEEAGVIVGWGSLSKFHARAAYQPTVEDSVYIRHDRLSQGIGRLILQELLERAKVLGYHSIIAVISADQMPSVKLHERFGFAEVGLLKQVGRKYDRWLDVVYMQLMLRATR
jgi:L-amino acid N-acyltransferase YncA